MKINYKLLMPLIIAMTILSGCVKKYYTDCDSLYDVPTIRATLGDATNRNSRFYYEESAGVDSLGQAAIKDHTSWVKLNWASQDVMRLYTNDENKDFVAEFALADGFGTPNGVFRISKGADGNPTDVLPEGSYIAAVMSLNSEFATASYDYPTSEIALQTSYSNVGRNEVDYLSDDVALSSISGKNYQSSVDYQGGNYVGKFSFVVDYPLFTLFISKPADYVAGADESQSLKMKTLTLQGQVTIDGVAQEIEETINFTTVPDDFAIFWTTATASDEIMIYVPFPAGDYSEIAFFIEDDDNTYGARYTPETTTDFASGVRYVRYIKEWELKNESIEGNYYLPNIAGSFDLGGTNW